MRPSLPCLNLARVNPWCCHNKVSILSQTSMPRNNNPCFILNCISQTNKTYHVNQLQPCLIHSVTRDLSMVSPFSCCCCVAPAAWWCRGQLRSPLPHTSFFLSPPLLGPCSLCALLDLVGGTANRLAKRGSEAMTAPSWVRPTPLTTLFEGSGFLRCLTVDCSSLGAPNGCLPSPSPSLWILST